MKWHLTWAVASAVSLGIGGLGAASAADMAMKAPPMPAAVYSWTGFYVGINGGGLWDRDHLTSAPIDPGTTAFWAPCFAAGACPRDYGRSNGSSGEVGGQFGYNWQVNNVILGIETDIQWTDAKGTASVALANTGTGFVPYNGTATSKLDWFGTTRGRIGFAPGPTWMVYGTAGVAYGEIQRSWTANFPVTAQLVAGSDTSTAVGWTAGAGVEFKPWQNWIFGVEYLHLDLGSKTFNANGIGSAGCTTLNCNFNVNSDHFRADLVRARVSYQFGGPVVARY
jgi:outer membrane immunogenic protein